VQVRACSAGQDPSWAFDSQRRCKLKPVARGHVRRHLQPRPGPAGLEQPTSTLKVADSQEAATVTVTPSPHCGRLVTAVSA
jgi:hypothetical protein